MTDPAFDRWCSAKLDVDRSPYAQRVHYHFDDQPETRLDAAALLATP